jgi:hypothetical protein
MSIDLDLPASRTAAAMATVQAGLDELAHVLHAGGVRDLCHADLVDLVGSARRAQARLESAVLVAAGEVDAVGSHVHEGALTTAAWLRMHTRATPGEAGAMARTSRVLRSGALPGVAAALASGDISARHAQVIATGVEGAPAGAVELIEAEAVEVAEEADVRAVSALMRRFRHALDSESADAAAMRRWERRGLTLVAMLDGTMAIRGTADEASGAMLATAVDTIAPLEPGDSRSAAQRRLDGLTEICRRFLADPDAPRRGGGGRPHLIVTIDQAGLLGDAAAGREGPADDADHADDAGGSPGGTLGWVGPITASTAQRIGCDATYTIVGIGPDGEVVEAGMTHRYFRIAQRRAMVARDGDRCVWPWCDRPVAWSDGHHIVPVAAGGPTTVANGALPCEGHHVMCHEGGWRLERLPDGRYRATHRDGRTLGPESHPPGHSRPPPHQRE